MALPAKVMNPIMQEYASPLPSSPGNDYITQPTKSSTTSPHHHPCTTTILSFGDVEEDPFDGVMNDATEPSLTRTPQGDHTRRYSCLCCSSVHPPTYAIVPNGLCAIVVIVVCVLSVTQITERLAFVVDAQRLQILSATMWSGSRTEIVNGLNSTVMSVEEALFPECPTSSSVVFVLGALRVSSIATIIASFLGVILMSLDALMFSLPRRPVMTPLVVALVASIVRWICDDCLTDGSFCGSSVSDLGYTVTSSLATKVVSVIGLSIAAVVYY